MFYDSTRLRSRAIDCRNIAKGTRNKEDAELLEELAFEMEEEARRIDEEKRR